MGTRPFIDTLREIEYGNLLEDLAEQQQKLVDAVLATQKKGSLTIKLNYVPEGDGQITINAEEPKISEPKMARGKTLFFATPERNLTRNDPRQGELEGLRQVSDDEQPARTVNHG